MKRKSISIILSLIFLCLLSYYVFTHSGYTFTENKALRQSYPFQNGHVVYRKEFDNKKIVIWNASEMKYAILMNTKWGILHQVRIASVLIPREPSGPISRTWSARLNSKKYETLFAVVEKNSAIEKVIISNDNIDNEVSVKLDEIKNKSSIFMELKVEEGFAVSYNELPINFVGNFVFRGLDKNG